ncbi:MAG: HlyD family efflux transporter periplasmic adaptor subunit [bacterium]|nr:HlyD family efflux transporter periplasmic adaptor subunit [bacterium]
MRSVVSIWLARVCEIVPGSVQGVVVLATEAAPHEPFAVWPPAAKVMPELRGAAAAALKHERPVVSGKKFETVESGQVRGRVAVPFNLTSGGRGAVALELLSETWDAQRRLAQLGAALAWLEPLIHSDGSRERVVEALELLGLVLEYETFEAASRALATEIATRLELQRVSIGFRERGHCVVDSISRVGKFDPHSQLVVDLGNVMDEAADQDAAVLHPQAEGEAPRITRAHEALVRDHGAASVLTIPLAFSGRVVGAIICESDTAIAAGDERLRVAEDASVLLGPLLHLRRLADRRWFERARTRMRTLSERLFGPGHAETKLIACALSLLVLGLAFVNGEYRARSEAVLEGRVRRAIVAGTEGYIGEANARAGDIVQAGQVLGRLDERDLALERLKWAAQTEQLKTEQREALALHDRAKVNILSAKVAAAEAQMSLLDSKLERTRLVAPFDGVVVRGDLSQALGSPVSKGDVLFEVAPLDGYRIMLQIDERDVRRVSAGNKGQLMLSALPGRSLPLTVEQVTPVAVAEDGRNYFRAEARLDVPVDSLRPGMQGVAKIDVGSRSLLWIFTHRLIDWLRLSIWSWLP